MRKIAAILIACLILSCNPATERIPYFAVHGIDVSHYQARINWDTIADQNIDFAFVKATEGGNHSDSLFCKNWSEIKKVGLKRGAYHFFRPKSDVLTQAQNFIDEVQLEDGDLPPVLDVEVEDGVDAADIINRIKIWVEIVEHHYQVRPIIYTNLKFFNRYIQGNFEEYPIWIARYNSKKPYLGKNRNWHFWQYGDRGKLNGIDGFVDFNVFHGTLQELDAICISENPDKVNH